MQMELTHQTHFDCNHHNPYQEFIWSLQTVQAQISQMTMIPTTCTRPWVISQLIELNIEKKIHYIGVYSQVFQSGKERNPVHITRGPLPRKKVLVSSWRVQAILQRECSWDIWSKNGRVRNRTGDLSHAKGARYQLRHTPKITNNVV